MYMMMKRFFAFWSLLLVAVCASAVPAKPGIWKTLLLDGVEVKAQLVGDEHLHYWLSEDGRNLVEKDGRFVLADVDAMRQASLSRRHAAVNRQQRRARRNAIGDFMNYEGQDIARAVSVARSTTISRSRVMASSTSSSMWWVLFRCPKITSTTVRTLAMKLATMPALARWWLRHVRPWTAW